MTEYLQAISQSCLGLLNVISPALKFIIVIVLAMVAGLYVVAQKANQSVVTLIAYSLVILLFMLIFAEAINVIRANPTWHDIEKLKDSIHASLVKRSSTTSW